MDQPSSSRLRSERLAAMETTRFNADSSSIGKVTTRGSHFAPSGSLASHLNVSPLGISSGTGASKESKASRFHAVPPVKQAHSSYTSRRTETKSKGRLGTLADHAQERISSTNRGLFVAGAIIAILVVCTVALYGPLRDYYVARRANEYLSVQLEALETANAEVEEKLEALQTPEGIEDEARRRGYIEKGSTAVNVVGAPEESDSSTEGSAFTEVKEVETHWYTDMLDKFFGYTPPDL